MTRIRLVALLIAAVALASAAAAISSTGTPGKAAAAKTAAKPMDAAAKAKMIERGKFLALVSGCNDCHTPGTLLGAPDFARALSGSDLGWQGPWGTTYARNLTPDLETGLGYYKEEEIVKAMKGGTRLDGSPMLPPMPWQSFTAYNDEDMHALAAYMLSLPPVSHAVPDRLPPGKAPTGSVLTFPAPPAWDAPRASPIDSGTSPKR
ncbi:MAG TPA: c-type cytochrome [Candidatus Eisenbacteria bacterium]